MGHCGTRPEVSSAQVPARFVWRHPSTAQLLAEAVTWLEQVLDKIHEAKRGLLLYKKVLSTKYASLSVI